jgi:hypothetical protein
MALDKTDNQFFLSDSEIDEMETEEEVENVEATYEGGARRTIRNIQPPARLNDYERFPNIGVNDEGDVIQLAMLAEAELVSFDQALKQKHSKEAMIDELKSIEKNETWKLVGLISRYMRPLQYSFLVFLKS